jgi:ATP-dependent Lon protease
MSQSNETLPPAGQAPLDTPALPVSDPGAEAGQPFEIAVLALQNLTLFPETVIPLAVGRPRSTAAVESALSTQEKLLGCITVRPDSADDTDANTSDLYEVGTLVMIKRMERVGDAMRIVVQGTERIKVIEWKQPDPFMRATVQILPEPHVVDPEEVEAAKRNLQEMIQQALALLPSVPPEVRVAVLGSVEAVRLAYFLGSILTLGVEEEQKMLEANTADELLRLAHANVARELEILQLRSKIASEDQSEMDKSQRDYVLRQQMKAIQKELGDDEGGEAAEAQLLR